MRLVIVIILGAASGGGGPGGMRYIYVPFVYVKDGHAE